MADGKRQRVPGAESAGQVRKREEERVPSGKVRYLRSVINSQSVAKVGVLKVLLASQINTSEKTDIDLRPVPKNNCRALQNPPLDHGSRAILCGASELQ